ncbi:MAG: alpha/beta hydrolase [Chloroflexota bacterium]|nr:MAG: alpha/beta hydrolase [Chloroflexota bacterium]
MSALIIDNAIVHYEALGHGKPVIFLHSWIGSWRYWIPSMQFASTRFRAYALDLWGFGATKKISSRYALEKQVSLLKEFIDQMGLGDFTLVGHGLGSIIAAFYAADYAQYVEKLMLVSFPMGTISTNPRLQKLSPKETADWLLGDCESYIESCEDAKKTDPQAISISFKQFQDVNWRQLLNRLTVSSIWIHGENDQAICKPTEEQLEYLPECAQFLLFSDSGHFPMLDETSNFNRLLTNFIQLPAGEDPRNLEVKEIWKRRVR